MPKFQSVAIELPSDILLVLNESEGKLKQEIKLALAVRLYQREKVTIGKAAQIAGLSRLAFETALSESGIPISALSFEEIMHDASKLK